MLSLDTSAKVSNSCSNVMTRSQRCFNNSGQTSAELVFLDTSLSPVEGATDLMGVSSIANGVLGLHPAFASASGELTMVEVLNLVERRSFVLWLMDSLCPWLYESSEIRKS